MNIQALTDPFGRLLWASPALPGATHEVTAARTHGVIDALVGMELKCWADKAYQGAGRPIRVPFRGRRLKWWKRRHNSTHAEIRCLGEQAMATLKGWRVLRKLRCSTTASPTSSRPSSSFTAHQREDGNGSQINRARELGTASSGRCSAWRGGGRASALSVQAGSCARALSEQHGDAAGATVLGAGRRHRE